MVWSKDLLKYTHFDKLWNFGVFLSNISAKYFRKLFLFFSFISVYRIAGTPLSVDKNRMVYDGHTTHIERTQNMLTMRWGNMSILRAYNLMIALA